MSLQQGVCVQVPLTTAHEHTCLVTDTPTLDVADLDAELTSTRANMAPAGEREVTIVKQGNRGLGLKLATDEVTNVTTILEVVEGGAAAETRGVSCGFMRCCHCLPTHRPAYW